MTARWYALLSKPMKGALLPEQPSGLVPGEVVAIQQRPLRGYEAIFDARISGEERVRVLLKILNRELVPLELPAKQIQRKKQ